MRIWLQRASAIRDASIHGKLLIAPTVLILALVLISGMAIVGLQIQGNALARIDAIALKQITLIDRFAVASEQVQSDVYRIAVLRYMDLPEVEIQPVQARLEQGANELKILYGEIATSWALDETERDILHRMQPPMDEFRFQAQQAVVVVMENPSFGVLMVRSSTRAFGEFRSALSDLLDYQHAKISRTQAETTQKIGTLKTTIVVSLFLMALAGIVSNLSISTRLIAQPIQGITQLMKRLAENDLSIEIQGLDRGDEIGAMARAVEVFRNNAIEKERLDKELRESEQRLLMAQSVGHIGSWELDLASKTMWASTEAFRIYGLERTSPYLTLAQIQEISLREDRPKLDAALAALVGKKGPYDEEFRIKHSEHGRQEALRVIHSLANLVCDETGTPVKVVGVIQDITARKLAEDALRQSEMKFSLAFQTSPYAITITLAHDGKIIDVNDAFTRITGITRGSTGGFINRAEFMG